MGGTTSTAVPFTKEWDVKSIQKLRQKFNDVTGAKASIENVDQLKELMKDFLNIESEADWKKLFDDIDVDKNQSLDYIEIASYFTWRQTLSSEEKLVKYFDMFDKDGSMKLETNELTTILTRMIKTAKDKGYKFPIDDYAQYILIKLDEDKSGDIDLEEWKKIAIDSPSLLILLGIKKV